MESPGGLSSPILALRNRLTQANEDDVKMPPAHRLALLIKAFGMYRNRMPVPRKGLFLRDNEKFPRIERDLSSDEAA